MTAISHPVGPPADGAQRADTLKSRDVSTTENTCQDTEGQALITCAGLPAHASVLREDPRRLPARPPAAERRRGVQCTNWRARFPNARTTASTPSRAPGRTARRPVPWPTSERACGWSIGESRCAGSTRRGTGWAGRQSNGYRPGLRRRALPCAPAAAVDGRSRGHDDSRPRFPGPSRADSRRNAPRYPALVARHAAAADGIVVVSEHVAEKASRLLRIDPNASASARTASRGGHLPLASSPATRKAAMFCSSARSSLERTWTACWRRTAT